MPDDETPDQEGPPTTDTGPPLTEDHLDDALVPDVPLITPRGIPETSQGYDYSTEYQEWYESLRVSPRGDTLDTVLTANELCERWRCNFQTLRRLLERYDLRIEHREIKTRTGTYRELARIFIAEGFADMFLLSFFDLSEDALFRARDVVAFEKSHPEVMMALNCKELGDTYSPSET